MKHNIKYILSVCIGIALTMGLSAQTLNSSYFMEKMTKRNQLNPALRDCHSRRCCGTAEFSCTRQFLFRSELQFRTWDIPLSERQRIGHIPPPQCPRRRLSRQTHSQQYRRTRFGIRHHLFWILGMGWTKHVQPRPQKLFGSIYAQRNIPISQNRTKRNY